ncbi:neprilysin-2-like [Amblyomma americanum]
MHAEPITNDSHQPWLERRAQLAKSITADDGCRSQLCQWNRDYILRAADVTKDPCDDFYAHACNAQRWFRMGSALTRPFAELSTTHLMVDIERFFRYYVQLKGEPTEDNFLSRMMSIYDACRNDTVPRANISAELRDIFEVIGLPSALPIQEIAQGQLAHVVAAGDRHMALHPLFKVRVLLRRESSGVGGFDIVLSAPDTLYRRFLTNFVDSTDSMYADFVAKTLSLCTMANTRSAARKIMQLEKRLESFMLASDEELMMPPREKYVSLDELFFTDTWDWPTYFNSLIANANGSIGNDTKVVVMDAIFFRNFGTVLGGAWDAIVTNYMAYKAVVELAPVLGQDAEYLLQFTHSYDVPDLGERQAACLTLMEKLFRYGTGIVAKLTLGKEFATMPRSHMDLQLGHLFNASMHLVAGLIDSGRSWFDAFDKDTASRKLRAMRFEFGAQCNLVEYELYRRNSVQLNMTSPWPLKNDDGKHTDHLWPEHPLPRIVFDLYSVASAAYWDVWGSSTSRAYDNRYTLTAFRPGYELQHTGNLLVVPHATVAFLSQLSNLIHPVTYGVVAANMIRGLLEALARSGSSVDAELRSRLWWSIGSLEAYENISTCIESQHQPYLVEGARMRTLELDFLDNAMAYPLFRLYRDAVTRYAGANMTAPSGVRAAPDSLTLDQMFFYNFATAHCDFRDEELWKQQRKFHITPAPWRVNVPLMNLPAFADAFGCKRGSRMNPAKRCNVWK